MNIPDEIRREMDFPLPVERVWQAVSTPEGLSKWFSDQVEQDETGRELTLIWDEYGSHRAKVEAVEPPRRFAFRWGAHGYTPGEPFTAENSTLVTFFLQEREQGTRLTVLETGFAGLAPEHRRASFEDNTGGWETELAELQAYLSAMEAA